MFFVDLQEPKVSTSPMIIVDKYKYFTKNDIDLLQLEINPMKLFPFKNLFLSDTGFIGFYLKLIKYLFVLPGSL